MSKAILIGEINSNVIEYTGFSDLKHKMDCRYAEVAVRGMMGDIRVLLLVDEEGRLKDRNYYNDDATFIANSLVSMPLSQFDIVGTAALVKRTDEDLEGFTEAEAEQVAKWLSEAGIAFAS